MSRVRIEGIVEAVMPAVRLGGSPGNTIATLGRGSLFFSEEALSGATVPVQGL